MSYGVDVQTDSTPIEYGDSSADTRVFRRALGQFATGVTVITTGTPDTPVGIAANSFSTVSLDPPLVLWSLRKESRRVPDFIHNGHFAISILRQDQMDVAYRFGRPGEDPFLHVDWNAGRYGGALIQGAIAHLECTTESVLDGGDHHILVGRVEHFARYGGAPLLFSQGRYSVTEEHPGVDLAADSSAQGRTTRPEDPLFMSVLRATDHHMSTLFDGYRHEVGVTRDTARILNHLATGPSPIETLRTTAFLGENAVEEALSDLMERGHVQQGPPGTWQLTDRGHDVHGALHHSAERFTARQLHGIPERDLGAAVRVLQTLLGRCATET